MYPKMDVNIFSDVLNNNGWIEAIKYKDKYIPNSLYKYCSLLDENYADFINKNKKKLDSLRENKLWVSNYRQFNDPFEFKMLALDVDKLSRTNWEIDRLEELLGMFKDRTLVTCFSSQIDDNMPMWAHYANNHKGYCIKYYVLNPRTVFPVQYEPKRSKCAVIPTMIANEIAKSYSQGLKEPTDEFYKYFTYVYLSFCCKHSFWKYEEEYRLLYQNIDVVNGESIRLQDVGLKIEAIYIGYKCEDNYKKELINIGSEIGCEVYKMDFDEYDENFKLKSTRII